MPLHIVPQAVGATIYQSSAPAAKPAPPSFALQPFLPQWHHNPIPFPPPKSLNPQTSPSFLPPPPPHLSPTAITAISTLATTPQRLAATPPNDGKARRPRLDTPGPRKRTITVPYAARTAIFLAA
ncbi:hypothetical protein COCMIDRAFT_38839 [Bipolaris oryzae ATCC 44560]|uniref:Uncharacterized protein n=1 Tax=Bipolaris oryzae ATCC 44560 TaxID=930090 RepID=W6Z6S2_COCMI|nr:uncharacterized protein COCMIDRAFT_38839 [Bipolaris oryzae ATCC 44560]EUC43239.1 hypothetical protein COCMIDRAFT_38839 [Bipolaris oryzae ATCC 44560]